MQTPREVFRKLMNYQPGGELPARIFNWHWTFGMYGGTDTQLLQEECQRYLQ